MTNYSGANCLGPGTTNTCLGFSVLPTSTTVVLFFSHVMRIVGIGQ